ncbi:MAG: hypothetical protein ACRC4O_05305 [Giesbergeria sp.]
MALLGNGVRYGSMNPGRTGFGVASVYAVSRSGNQSGGGLRNWWASEATYSPTPAQPGAVYTAIPDGYNAPGAWALAPKPGGMASRNMIAGSGTVSAAALFSSTPLTATLAGTGSISDAACALVVSLAATLAGVGSLSASLVGGLQLAATLAGQGSLAASLKVVAGLVATLPGTGSVGANLTGYANMEADILPYTDLSPQALAAAVWNAAVASYQEAGSTGEALAAGGNGGGAVSTYNSTRSVAGEARWLAGSTASRQFRLLGLDGEGEDLSGYSVTAYCKPDAGGATFSRSCTVVTAASGDVSFSMSSQQWGYLAGKGFLLQFKTVNGGTTRYYPEDGPVEVMLDIMIAE